MCVCVVAEKEFLILREDRQTDTRPMFHDVVVQLVAVCVIEDRQTDRHEADALRCGCSAGG